jgi:hypothetical protein
MKCTQRLLKLFLFCLPVCLYAQQPLTNVRIIELWHSGVHADELQRVISTAPSISFNLTPAATDSLLSAGISEDVIKAMAARENGTMPTATVNANNATPVLNTGTANGLAPSPSKVASQAERVPSLPRFEVYTGYSYLNVDTNSLSSRQSLNGFETSASVGIVRHLAAEGSFAAYFKNNVLGSIVSAHDLSFLGGPRVTFGEGFVHALVGVDRFTGSALGLSASQTGFAGAFGGGVQSKPFGRHFAVGTSADYVLTRHNMFGGPAYTQNNFRLGGGIVFLFDHVALR